MKKAKARRMLDTAMEYVGEDVYVPYDFEAEVTQRVFLEQYLWTIYVSGFRNAIVERNFRELKRSFHNLSLKKIAAMRSVNAAKLPIRNKNKASAFLKGCKHLDAEGWRSFKKRILDTNGEAIRELPFMGEANAKLMQLSLGICDTEKPDVWMIRCAEACSATVEELVIFLAKDYELSRMQVDNYLWQFCRDHQRLP